VEGCAGGSQPYRESVKARGYPMHDRIVFDPNVCHGKAIIRGTRVPVARIIGYLAGGMSYEDAERDFDLTMEDIRAALDYAAELLNKEEHHPLPA